MRAGRAHVATAMVTMLAILGLAKGNLGGLSNAVRRWTNATPPLPSTQSGLGRSGFAPDAQASEGAGGGGGKAW